ncbi:MAG: SOS response-associated peptidase family protein [Oscillospiraceae bacterium]
MCGRFYMDPEQCEIERLTRELSGLDYNKGEIFPSNTVPIIENGVAVLAKWGMSTPFREKGLVINARFETVGTRELFKKSLISRRCAVAVSGFYEWDKNKNKFYFTSSQGEILWIAALLGFGDNARNFVVLTTRANDDVKNIHHRMPVLLAEEQLCKWFGDTEAAMKMLTDGCSPPLISAKSGNQYEQLMFDI